MQKTLLVCSKSTRKYLPEFKNVYYVTGSPTIETLKLVDSEEKVVAIGGGAVIDTAKIICSGPIVCYPTTAAGSSCTSHSVYWDDQNKLSIRRKMPKAVIVLEEHTNNLPNKIKEYTTYDVISHCLDSLWSNKKTKESELYAKKALSILRQPHSNAELINAGNYGGMAIERCPTTILHAMSYPLTSFYNIPHGKALGFLLPKIAPYYNFDLSGFINYKPVVLSGIDWDLVCHESLKYEKIYNTIKPINNKILKKLIKTP